MKHYFRRMKTKAKCPPRKPLHKILWSWAGSFLGIGIIAALSHLLNFVAVDNFILVGSFGASAVLVYGVPMAEFSQPRNLVGGHVVSAVIGVAIFTLLGKIPVLASALSVSLSILAMHLSRTLHPPGGATALIAVLGGDNIHALGYRYVLCPILTGAVVLLVVALFVNNMSRDQKRHYPVYWI